MGLRNLFRSLIFVLALVLLVSTVTAFIGGEATSVQLGSYPDRILEKDVAGFTYGDSSKGTGVTGSAVSVEYAAIYYKDDLQQLVYNLELSSKSDFQAMLDQSKSIGLITEQTVSGTQVYDYMSGKKLGFFYGDNFIYVQSSQSASENLLAAYLAWDFVPEELPEQEDDGSDDDSSDTNTTDTNQTQTQNNVPVLGSVSDRTVYENETLSIQLSASDADNDTLTYSADTSKGSLDGASGLFTWTPDFSEAGEYSFRFEVSDGEDSDSETIKVTVMDVASGSQPEDNSTEEPTSEDGTHAWVAPDDEDSSTDDDGEEDGDSEEDEDGEDEDGEDEDAEDEDGEDEDGEDRSATFGSKSLSLGSFNSLGNGATRGSGSSPGSSPSSNSGSSSSSSSSASSSSGAQSSSASTSTSSSSPAQQMELVVTSADQHRFDQGYIMEPVKKRYCEAKVFFWCIKWSYRTEYVQKYVAAPVMQQSATFEI